MTYLLTGQESQRLIFRPLQADDFDQWLTFYQHPASTQYWQGEPRDPVLNCRNWFDKTFQRYQTHQGGMNVLIHKKTGAFVGQCGLLPQRVDDTPELEIGYSILPHFWNQGYATEAATKCRQYAFDNQLSSSLISIIHELNIASQAVAVKTGMTLDKKTTYSGNPVFIYRIWG